MLRPWKLYALEDEKRRRILGDILMHKEHLEMPWGAAWKPQAAQKGCQVFILEAGGACLSEPAPAGQAAQVKVLQGTKHGTNIL